VSALASCGLAVRISVSVSVSGPLCTQLTRAIGRCWRMKFLVFIFLLVGIFDFCVVSVRLSILFDGGLRPPLRSTPACFVLFGVPRPVRLRDEPASSRECQLALHIAFLYFAH
jgi:hypothetical protein